MFSAILNVNADDCAKKSEIKGKVDAKYYCYYNKSGLKSDDYNVIVGISGDKKNAYADIGTCGDSAFEAGTEPIANWKYNDSNWDSDLESSFSAKKYYEENNTCPEIAYIHYYPMNHVLYLINSEQLSDLINTFSYSAALDNEKKYYLVDFDTSKETKMSCDYKVKMKENTASTEKNYNVKFTLNFNQDGKVINANNIAERVELAPEISSNYKYVKDVCPQLYICHVLGKTYSAMGTAVSEYKYELYFADYETIYNREDCYKISCNNTSKKYCDNSSEDSEICPKFDQMYDELEQSHDASLSNKKDVPLYKKNKDNLKSYCNSLLSDLNADNPCLRKCLKLKEKIFALENKDYNDEACGFSGRLISFFANILRLVKYILPVGVIVFGILDFIKAIGAAKEDEMKKAQQRFIRRLVAAALVFIIPLILEFILDKMGFGYDSCSLF